MKKKFFLPITILCFCISSVWGQDNASDSVKNSWGHADRTEFISACIKVAQPSMGTDSARYYCYCMQSKVEAKFPDPVQADKLTKDDFSSAEWKKEIKACLSGGTWTKLDREEFVSNCIRTAKEGGLSETKAKNYCECMQFKVEKRYPNADDLTKVTNDDFKSEYWQKLIASCLAN
jgi:hypothetical protein